MNREIENTIHTIHLINFYLLSSFKIKKMVMAKIKATTTALRFLLARNSRNPSFGRIKSLFIQKKQTNYYLIAVTLRLGLSSQVTRAHFVSTRVIFPILFSIASKYLQYWLVFETLDWISSTELSYHVYLLRMLLHHHAFPFHVILRHAMPCHDISTPFPCLAMPFHFHAFRSHAIFMPLTCLSMPSHFHALPCHAISMHFQAMPCHFHAISMHFQAMPCHFHVFPCHFIPYLSMPCLSMQCHVMPFLSMTFHAIPFPCHFHALSCHAISMPRQAIAMSCLTKPLPCHASPSHVISMPFPCLSKPYHAITFPFHAIPTPFIFLSMSFHYHVISMPCQAMPCHEISIHFLSIPCHSIPFLPCHAMPCLVFP
jgi:hypothetical protein